MTGRGLLRGKHRGEKSPLTHAIRRANLVSKRNDDLTDGLAAGLLAICLTVKELFRRIIHCIKDRSDDWSFFVGVTQIDAAAFVHISKN